MMKPFDVDLNAADLTSVISAAFGLGDKLGFGADPVSIPGALIPFVIF